VCFIGTGHIPMSLRSAKYVTLTYMIGDGMPKSESQTTGLRLVLPARSLPTNLLRDAVEHVKRMSPDEYKKRIEAQKESWARQDRD
jgi:hypothetical protein